jgi:hypothetical protein
MKMLNIAVRTFIALDRRFHQQINISYGLTLAARVVAATTFSLMPLSLFAQSTPIPIQQQPPSLGAGYQSIGDEVVGTCVDYPKNALQSNGGASDTLNLTRFDSSTSIRREFSLDGSATFGWRIQRQPCS